MEQELATQVAAELQRIAALPLDQQPSAFDALRVQLEATLEGERARILDESTTQTGSI